MEINYWWSFVSAIMECISKLQVDSLPFVCTMMDVSFSELLKLPATLNLSASCSPVAKEV
jgi:hypothetical protein